MYKDPGDWGLNVNIFPASGYAWHDTWVVFQLQL